MTIKAPAFNLQSDDGTNLKTLLNSTLLTWLEAHVHTSAASGSPTSPPVSATGATVPIPTTVETVSTKAE